MSIFGANQEATEGNPEKLKACQETESNPGMMQSIGEYQEVPKEEAAVMPVGGLSKRNRDRNLATGHRQKPKGSIQASLVLQKRLTIAGRKMTRRAKVAWCKKNIARKYCTGASVVKEIWRRWTFRRRRHPKPECSNGIRSRDVEEPVEEPLHLEKRKKTAISIRGWSRRQQPQLESMGNGNKVFGKTNRTGVQEADSQIYCFAAKNQRLDLVERSAPF
jgi:hypothetical protein